MKNRYGVSPWGAWFIDVLDSYEIGERLNRGRRYANSGRVLSLELSECRASAKVEGNSSPFYKVAISFPYLKETQRVYDMIENDRPLLAQIAGGQLPEEFLLKLKKEGIKLIPENWQEMKRSCNCPDYGDPCKHMAAVYYIIASEIDANPHILFRLRGMNLNARFGAGASYRLASPFTVAYSEKNEGEKQNKKLQMAENLKAIPHCGKLIASLLPPSPSFCARDFSLVMAEFYHICAQYQGWENAFETDQDTERHFSMCVWTVECLKPRAGAEPALVAYDINGDKKSYTLYEAFEYFSQFSSQDGTESYTFLFYLFKFLNLLCQAGALIPYALLEDEELLIIWRPFETLPLISHMQQFVASRECYMLKASPSFRIDLSKTQAGKKKGQYVSAASVVDLLSCAFLTEWVRRKYSLFGQSAAKEKNDEYRKLVNLFFLRMSFDISSPAYRSLPVAIDRWLSVLHINFTAFNYSINIKENPSESSSQNEEENSAPVNFLISMDVVTEEEAGLKKTPLAKVKNIEALRAPIALSNYLGEIRSLTNSADVPLSGARLVSFLDEAADLLARLGIKVNLPKSLARELKPRLVVSVKKKQGSLVKYLDINALQDFNWQIAIGDEVLSVAEFKKLVKEKRALVRFRDGFVKMNPGEFSRLLKKAREGAPNVNDFLKAHFSGDSVLAFDEREVIENLFREHKFDAPGDLMAKLRPYQKRGYNWICSLLFSGFGCILADDMGLGKTVQAIAAILHLKKEGRLEDKCLVVAPAALITNWEKELARFAPTLRVARYHGKGRKLGGKSDVFLTTYQTTVRDAKKLEGEAFSMLLVDEAHLMKNAETLVSRTVKQIRANYRLALSGTPVENRLEDLRSLFDFILPGYLGDSAVFRHQYRIPIEVMRDIEKAQSLKKITAPFLLRRVKTDKNIIKDLPDKIVTNEYASLEKEQAALYESVVSESIKKSEKLEPKDRASLIFNLLTSLKQICDHPRVYDKESPAVSHLSGKAQLLVTLLQEITANREKTLIFSQYVETLECLEKIIRKELAQAPVIYHGALNQSARAEIVEKFQKEAACRIMLVSLKAGGLGLNLTAASRVIHYDLWYNPAVENQATDRAFRIGQKCTVFVHRFITKNSFEEKIDAMITNKQELADMTVASGESWIAKMNHKELQELFAR